MRRTVPALCVALALVACKGSERAPQEEPAPASPGAAASAPPITVANVMGECEDVPLCERECDAGEADRCRRLGVTYEFGKSDAGKNETRGTAYFDRSCALGNAPGCVSSGQMHEYGHGVPKDFAVAAAAYEKACTIGWQVGCANWAIMLENGRGVAQDLGKARTLYAGACKAGAGLACDRLQVLGRDAG